MIRAAILYDDRDRNLGKTMVTDSTFVIRHQERFFFRTNDGVRLTGGGIGARFIEMDPLVRDKLETA
ncbi:MAG: hypothetical protein Q7S17_05740 [Xanthobacteraceae bacterium]|nr:hypothetical protein [Xanthobacteraceae bacterium]